MSTVESEVLEGAPRILVQGTLLLKQYELCHCQKPDEVSLDFQLQPLKWCLSDLCVQFFCYSIKTETIFCCFYEIMLILCREKSCMTFLYLLVFLISSLIVDNSWS